MTSIIYLIYLLSLRMLSILSQHGIIILKIKNSNILSQSSTKLLPDLTYTIKKQVYNIHKKFIQTYGNQYFINTSNEAIDARMGSILKEAEGFISSNNNKIDSVKNNIIILMKYISLICTGILLLYFNKATLLKDFNIKVYTLTMLGYSSLALIFLGALLFKIKTYTQYFNTNDVISNFKNPRRYNFFHPDQYKELIESLSKYKCKELSKKYKINVFKYKSNVYYIIKNKSTSADTLNHLINSLDIIDTEPSKVVITVIELDHSYSIPTLELTYKQYSLIKAKSTNLQQYMVDTEVPTSTEMVCAKILALQPTLIQQKSHLRQITKLFFTLLIEYMVVFVIIMMTMVWKESYKNIHVTNNVKYLVNDIQTMLQGKLPKSTLSLK